MSPEQEYAEKYLMAKLELFAIELQKEETQ